MTMMTALTSLVFREGAQSRFKSRAFVLWAVVCCQLVVSQAGAADAAGDVEDLRGSAFADAGQQHRALEKASPIYVGDHVSTGAASRLTMHLGADTTIKLGENTQLVIDKFLPQT